MSSLIATAEIASKAGASTTGIAQPGQFNFDTSPVEKGDGAQFRAALERHTNAHTNAMTGHKPVGNSESLGDKIMVRAGDLSSQVQKDQQYVSKLLEQATRTGDSMQLMKAMMALNDYQMRVQFISKTASKATSSVDQLTKLQ
ncbi:MAG: EscI/YscI/HrpB family type III secretion system inner rod protein [Burkholderiaceae bacterium]